MLMQNTPETDAAALAVALVAVNTQALSPHAAAALSVPSVSQKDTTWTKLFVGGLPYHTTDKSLREHFAVYGDIEEAVVITDRQTNKSRGYGFVIMGDRVSAERACKDPNPIIDGRKANVNLAILGAKPRGTIAPDQSYHFTTSPTAHVTSDSNFSGFPFATGLRTGYPVLPNQFGVPQSYVYGSPYLGATNAATAGLVPIQASQLSHAAALAAATNQFYEYQNAVAAAAASPYSGQYTGFEAYPYTTAASAGNCQTRQHNLNQSLTEQNFCSGAAAGYMPYAYATLPQAAAAGGIPGLSQYQQAGASLQEARLQ